MPLFRDRSGRVEWQLVFLFLVASLSSTILLKIGQAQYLEIVYVAEMGVLLWTLPKYDYSFSVAKPIAELGGIYVVVIATSLVLSARALGDQFYLPPGLSLLRKPFVITMLRSAEMAASVFALVYLAELFRREKVKTRFAVLTYFWVGVLSAAYSLASLPIQLLTGRTLGTYNATYRWRGFYNEGGPYGLYLISAILVGFVIYKLRWSSRRRLVSAMVLLMLALLGSQSKAAIAGMICLVLLGALRLSAGQRLFAGFLLGVLLLVATHFVSLPEQLRLYREVSLAYERASYQHSRDVNFIQGRVAGAFIVPRMLAEHPWAGVGWGNYGLVRNAPEYRGAAAWSDIADEPSLGLFGAAAELGIPLTLLLTFAFFFPYLYLRRIQAPTYVLFLALVQPVVHLFGAQFNLTYPWVVSAFALGLGLGSKVPETVAVTDAPLGTLASSFGVRG